jgi:very-short-patch-repair endonuclease
MIAPLNTSQFIERSKIIHGDKYDYSLVQYKNYATKVKIILDGKIYEQSPQNHLSGKCPERKTSKTNINEFIERSKIIHNNRYDYSLVEYKNNYTKVKIILDGKIYEQSPKKHLSGRRPEKRNKYKTNDEFIKKCTDIYGDRYDYSLVEYKSLYDKIKIIFKNNIYEIIANDHLNGVIPENRQVMNTKDFIVKSKFIHGDRYDYSKVNYFDRNSKVIILYNGSEYLQSPDQHLRGCNPVGSILLSKGEEKIRNFLDKNCIKYKSEFKFEDCKFNGHLPFDFYLEEYNLLIEYDGEHHFYPIDYFGGIDNYKKTLRNDEIKNLYANKNGINLLRIKYHDFDKIESIISDYILLMVETEKIKNINV